MQVVPRSYYTQRNDLIWSTIEIIHELQDSKGNQKYCAMQSRGTRRCRCWLGSCSRRRRAASTCPSCPRRRRGCGCPSGRASTTPKSSMGTNCEAGRELDAFKTCSERISVSNIYLQNHKYIIGTFAFHLWKNTSSICYYILIFSRIRWGMLQICGFVP